MMVAMAHAAPTAPAPIIPIFMMVLVFVKNFQWRPAGSKGVAMR
jgi:hypothetical protein